MTQGEALGNKDTGKPLRPFQWRMDFRKSPPGTRTQSVRQTIPQSFVGAQHKRSHEGVRMRPEPSQPAPPLLFPWGILNSILLGYRLEEMGCPVGQRLRRMRGVASRGSFLTG